MLARWSSWGAIPQVFDETNTEWATERAQLRDLLDDRAWDQARRTTINAHYTDPAYAAPMWKALKDLGFPGGAVLEPGCGSGTFMGMAPANANMVGVELDPTTAAIAAALYPQAQVRTESFADTRLPRNHFTAAIGNVPFADVRLHDPLFNPGNLTMHNHFIVKSLELTRPGGMVAVLTSAWTMDARNPAARRAINDLGDLVGAVRLPTGAHRRAAGTEALTDLLILRRREPGQEPADRGWETVTTVETADGATAMINSYFADHPDRVLGDLHVGTGMYGQDTVEVHPYQDTPGGLSWVLTQIVGAAEKVGLTFTATTPEPEQTPAVPEVITDLWDGTIVPGPDDTFQIARDGQLKEFPVPRTHTAELRELLGLRDRARDLLDTENRTREDTPELDAARDGLRAAYQGYVNQHGPINRYTLRRTGRTNIPTDPMTGLPGTDPETGQPLPPEPVMARITPTAVRLLRQDPYGPLVNALEVFDEETQQAAPAGLLTRRLLAPRTLAQGADTPAEALAISLDRTGTLDLATVAHLLGVDPESAREQLGDLAFTDPTTGVLTPTPEYLSGNVRAKLEVARVAAVTDPSLVRNVAALESVLPDPIGVEEISARLGAVWISPQIHEEFLTHILADRTVRVENPLPGHWKVSGWRRSLQATNEWGTQRLPATEIAERLMEQRPIEVKDDIEGADGRMTKVLNPVETTAAQEKAEALAERFGRWIWEDPARASTLGAEYNRRFNSLVLRDYSTAGDHLTLPGLAGTIKLREHQRTAVARMIAEPTVGLFHQVGAGKTLEMIVGATELRRLGLIRKPAVVVPNHMLDQFAREWLQAYPGARVLTASTTDLEGDSRRLFIARAAANDWDAVILTYEAFKRIPVSPDFMHTYITGQAEQLREALQSAQAASGSTKSVKLIEKAILAAEQAATKALDTPRDPGITWEATGVDYLIVDEAHTFKNLATVSNIQDARVKGSKHAADLHMKLEYLRGGKHGARVGCLATATPLANSITEAHVMQRYLRPDLLAAAGLTSFDAWAATFGEQVSAMEMGPAGGFRNKTRFARFTNVPEMLRMWHVPADVKTAEDLNLPVPALAPRPSDGARAVETVVLEPTPELVDYITAIADRAANVASRAVDGHTDNMLLISTDGRKAALDLRLIDPQASWTGPIKLDAVAATILAHHNTNSANTYLDASGAPSPTPGSLQLVFCDLGTPSEGRWNVYTELRAKLAAGGIPASQVRFIHEAKTDADKARLFAAARGGHIRVLIGSTAKMGVGTNIQDRVTALHHIDCPWRPADVEQRDGRAIRQGNQNPEVAVFRYVVERSFDAYSWQTVARKATFIAQVMRGRLDTREIEDIGDTALSAAEAKALASGNPLIMEKANADSAYQKLRRQEIAHQRGQAALRHAHTDTTERLANTERTITTMRQAAAHSIDTTAEQFRATIGGQVLTTRADAAEALQQAANDTRWRWLSRANTPQPIAEIGGHTVVLRSEQINNAGDRMAILALEGVPLSESRHSLPEILNAGIGLIRTCENKTTAISGNADRLAARQADDQRELAHATAKLGQPFPHTQALTQARQRVEQIDQALQALTRGHDPAAPDNPAQIALPSHPAAVSARALAAAGAAGPPRPTAPTVYPGPPTRPHRSPQPSPGIGI